MSNFARGPNRVTVHSGHQSKSNVERLMVAMTTHESHIEDRGDAIIFPTDLFVGRRHDLRRVRRLLVKGDSRLISIIGPAGVGKTRLAIEVARDAGEWFCGGVTMVRLAAVQRLQTSSRKSRGRWASLIRQITWR